MGEEILINAKIINPYAYNMIPIEQKHFPGDIAGPNTLHLLDNRSAMRISIPWIVKRQVFLRSMVFLFRFNRKCDQLMGWVERDARLQRWYFSSSSHETLNLGMNQPMKSKRAQENAIVTHNACVSFQLHLRWLTSHFRAARLETQKCWSLSPLDYSTFRAILVKHIFMVYLILSRFWKGKPQCSKTGEKVG